LLQGLQQSGWTDGRNVRIEIRRGGGDAARIHQYAAELVALAPDVKTQWRSDGAFGNVSALREAGMLRFGLLGIATLLATTSLTQAQTPVQRGSYLVNGLLTCGNCHKIGSRGTDVEIFEDTEEALTEGDDYVRGVGTTRSAAGSRPLANNELMSL
jgi:hypothetical protein